jgi:hypothetical protein
LSVGALAGGKADLKLRAGVAVVAEQPGIHEAIKATAAIE